MSSTPVTQTAIHPGEVWLDTKGNRIYAHGGSILYEYGAYYWYGENKEHSTGGPDVWHWGIRFYKSTDLINWEDLGVIIPPNPDDPDSPLHPAKCLDRPHIIHNHANGKYVCWIKIMDPTGPQRSTVLTADELLGPYTTVVTGLEPLGMYAGDFDLVVDPFDHKAYYYFERVHSELICADLTADYTGVTGYYSTHFPRPFPPYVREAPAYFRRAGKHYLITSGTTGYFPNASEIATADSYHGPWTVLGDAHPGDESRTSFRSQISSVFRHPEKEDLYIALADRWVPALSASDSNQAEIFRQRFSGEISAETFEAALPLSSEPNTSLADFVWLPIRFDGPVPRIEWVDSWAPSDFS